MNNSFQFRFLTRSHHVLLALVVASYSAVCGAQKGSDPKPEDAEDFALTVGLDSSYSTGTYGTPYTTAQHTQTLTTSVYFGDWSFDLDLPHITRVADTPTGARIVVGPRGRITVVGGAVGPPVPIRTSGMGDATATLTRSFFGDNDGDAIWDLGTVFKMSNGDANKGLGTGARDYSIQGGVTRPLGHWTVGGSLGYTSVGNGGGTTYKNIFYGSLNGRYALNDQAHVGIVFVADQSALAGLPQSRAIGFSLEHTLGAKARLQLQFQKGVSHGAPDTVVGATVLASF